MASFGASAMLIFAFPQSPMAQPWIMNAGNAPSALVGGWDYHYRWIDNPLLAMPTAAASFIMGMFLLRCIHSPAAAMAMIAVLGQMMQYRYTFSRNGRFDPVNFSWGRLYQHDR